MGKINVLPFAVANLIAAGEVVDRPASVIKELMENAIDAGATRVTVEIQNGGVTFMRVTDNGCGMTPEDLPVALRRHATSKIRDASDLDAIITLGFRGEALAAISSVSDVRIISKTADAPFGAVLEAHGGEVVSVTEQGCSTGTSVIVENLFANVPARRKFLKKDVTESMAVTANVEKVALSHPEIAFRLIIDGNVKLETAGDGVLLNTVYAVFGKDFASRLLEVDTDNEGIVVKGFLGRTDNFKANRNYENFFINGRFVKSKTATAALEQAYTSYMPPEKFPACVLFLTINPGRVDVNVHPAKLEVKFSNEKAVFEAIYYTVRTALENNVTRPAVQLDLGTKGRGFEGRMSDRRVPVQGGGATQLSYDLSGRTQPQPQTRMTAEEYRDLYASPAETKKAPAQAPQATVKAQTPPAPQTRPQSDLHAPVPTVTPAQTTAPTKTEAPTQVAIPTQTATPVPQSGTKVQITERTVIVPPGGPKLVNATPDAPPDAIAVMPERSDGMTLTEVSPIPIQPVPPEPQKPADGEEPALPDYRIVGEVFYSYVIVETGDKLLLIDKHAAHERILFEQLKARLASAEIASQMLMLPIDVMMTSGEVEALKEYNGELEKIGFSLRYARNTVSADAIPEGVAEGAIADMLQTMAGRILNATGSVRLTRDIIFEKALYQAACKAAVKAGRDYADGHVEWIVRQLMRLPDITFCPHGRPVALELTHHALDHQFDRTGF